MDPSKTIRTHRDGLRAAAARDNRLAKGEAPTRPIMLSSDDRVRDAAQDLLAALERNAVRWDEMATSLRALNAPASFIASAAVNADKCREVIARAQGRA